MNFIKRAFLHCFRKLSKSTILFGVLTIIATFMLTGIAIRDAAKGATTDVQTAIGGKIMLDIDMDNHMSDGEQDQWGTSYVYIGDYITSDIIDAINNVDGVVDYNAEETNGYYGAGVNFKYLPVEFVMNYTPYGEVSGYTVTLSSEKCNAFQTGKYNLVDGRHITSNDKFACLISKELADYNKLSVGDKIQMYSIDIDDITEFEIVGIFDGTEGGTSGTAWCVGDIPANCGYVAFAGIEEVCKKAFGTDYAEGFFQLTIFVEDPVSIQNVYDKIAALPELRGKSLKLSIDTDEYEVVSKPLESLQKLVNTTILIIATVSVVILILLLTIWVRGRKKEIGILLSIGKSKANIILQLFTEIFVVFVLSFAASIPFSDLIAEKAGAFLVSKVATGTVDLGVQIDASYLLPLYLIGIILITLAVIASSWTVIRSNPKDILTKMS